MEQMSMKGSKFDRTTAPATQFSACAVDPLEVVPVEAFATWTNKDFKDEIKRQAVGGPLCGYVCPAVLALMEQVRDMNPEPIKGGGMLALDKTMPEGVIRYDHGERQRALGLPIVHFYTPEGGKK